MTQPLRILLMSAGSLCARNVIDALAGRRQAVTLVGTNSTAAAGGVFDCDVAYLVPPAADPGYRSALTDIIAAERPDLVIPTRDDDVVALAGIKAERPDASGPVLLAGSVQAAELMDDKLASYRFAVEEGLPFATTVDTLDGALALGTTHGFPLIGKPARGNGTRGVVVLCSPDQVKCAFDRGPMVVQPYLDASPTTSSAIPDFSAGVPFFFSLPEDGQYAVQVVIGPDGRCSEPFASRNSMVCGRCEWSERTTEPALLDAGLSFAQAIQRAGWMGPFNVQFKRLPDGRFVAFEMNGRFTGTTSARRLLGFDEVGEVFRRFTTWNRETEAASTTPAFAVQKVLADHALPASAIERLQETGYWRRSC